MKNSILFLLILTASLFYSCAKKIDGTSEETMKSSIEEIKKSLTNEKKQEFEEALQSILFSGINISDILAGEEGSKKVVDDIKGVLNGLTSDEVIAKGIEIQRKVEAKKKEQAKIEIEELYQKKELASKNRKELKAFEVIKSRFYKRKKGSYYITYEPIIKLTVKNGTKQAISRAYFEGTLSSPERSVPWLKESFNYQISGGLEPDEEVTWSLAPNSFSDWGTVQAPKDAILTVEVIALDDAEGNKLYSIDMFDGDDEKRLVELLKNYPEFKKES